ncbi:MAG: C-type lectin domain-containing protein [Polyangiaceae bacterium]
MRACFVLALVLTACTMNFDAFRPGGAGTDAAVDRAVPGAMSADGASDTAIDSTSDASDDTTSISSDASIDTSDAASTDGASTTDATDAADGSDAAIRCTETGAVTFGGHCYFALGSTNTFAAASSACTAVGAHLVTITSSAESSAVTPINTSVDRWMGLSKNAADPATDASYHFVTGEARGGYSNWSPGEPNGSGDCVRMKAGGAQWADDGCTNLHDAICERE